LKETIHRFFYPGLTLLVIFIAVLGSQSAESDGLLKPPGLRPLDSPETIIPATRYYVNQKLQLPQYRDASGMPLRGWSREYVKTRRFSSDQSAWIYYRPADLKGCGVFPKDGMPDSLRIWPVGATLVLEVYKGDALRENKVRPVEIEVMTKLAPVPVSSIRGYFPIDWHYARYSPDGTSSLPRQKLIECHQCHSIAFRLTGDLIFTEFE
jgi:hypothetical protein